MILVCLKSTDLIKNRIRPDPAIAWSQLETMAPSGLEPCCKEAGVYWEMVDSIKHNIDV